MLDYVHMSGHSPHRFEASGDFIERLEGPERRQKLPPLEIVARMEPLSDNRVLDLGAGIGYFSFPMAERAREVVSVDIEPKMLGVIGDRIRERDVSNISLVRAEIVELPFASSSVDRIFAAFVYHEVPNEKRLIEECARVLKPSGLLTLADFQKRDTGIGPPLSERKTPEQVLRAAKSKFTLRSRFESEVFYQLELEKK